MEVPKTYEKPDDHMTSAAAFVEGGTQEACDDACSICLEDFCESNPSSVTTCSHEFHLQCILEWCQRSSQCPMCWQQIGLKDPSSQELLEAVVQERSIRVTSSGNADVFRHPAFGEFELQHLPVGAYGSDFEERLIQHLAAAAAMGRRVHRIGQRERHRTPTSSSGHPQFLVFSTQPGAHPSAPFSGSGRGNESAMINVGNPSALLTSIGDESSVQSGHFTLLHPQSSSSTAGSSIMATNHWGTSLNNNSDNLSSPVQDRAGPSDFQSFSESLMSKLSSLSMRYKESISNSTRGWKERWFSRNNSLPALGSEVQREVSTESANASPEVAAASNHLDDGSVEDRTVQDHAQVQNTNPSSDDDISAPRAPISPLS